jgi:hypothetical protein
MYKTDIVRTVAKETRLSRRIVADVLTESALGKSMQAR